MNIKNYSAKLAVASVALVSSVITFAPKAIAQTATFSFTREIETGCVFIGGTDAGSGSVTTESELTEDLVNNTLSGNNTDISVECNFDGGTLQITGVTEGTNEVTLNSDNNLTATLGLNNNASVPSLTANRGGSSTTSELDAGTTDMTLQLLADFGAGSQTLQAGSYSYEVQVTLANN
ncbi:hypothetical protein [Cyanobacterium aponinum]|uniref:Spore coat protein U domain-containing protein n=1 Tax=Cyanobacterium aponinum (strain PCC 10605) TaxID=755178 RepID=K9ZAC4_CYAAP|nr:hypothetical protein [Cyanobacterium aponinum]AFZ55323.1 hypothetical protein Cyan10605_3277 [Cyanobacterium aponinum PCC 10605]